MKVAGHCQFRAEGRKGVRENRCPERVKKLVLPFSALRIFNKLHG